jgi:2-hydroxycyclohexanecarboxyl-CoA dehydrogenase
MDPQSLNDGPGPLLPGKVAVITGGGGGIGAATARLLAKHGAHVVVADIDPELADQTVAEIRADGGQAEVFVVDVCEDAEVLKLRDAVLGRHGRCDVLVNNAGHFVRTVKDFLSSDPAFWNDLYRINLHHVFTATHAFLGDMVERKSGSIINVSSVEGLRGYPPDPVYAAFKAAVIHFTKSLAVQVGNSGVRVNGVAPDVTTSLQVPYDQLVPADQTHLWPQWVPAGRRGEGSDQARVILFLASDLSAFVTGHTIPTDGGTVAAGGWFRSPPRGLGHSWTNRPIAP